MSGPLKGLRFAPHYGCHYLKPGEVMDHFDEPERPHSLARLIEALGAESVDYAGLKDCCGGGVLGVDESLAQEMAFTKLDELHRAEAHGLVVICPFCNVMFEGQQKAVAKRFETKFKIPIYFYPQLLGLAPGVQSGRKWGSSTTGLRIRKCSRFSKPESLRRLLGQKGLPPNEK